MKSEKIEKVERLSLRMHIEPGLGFGDSIKYRIVENAPKGLYAINLPIEDINSRKTRYDYFGWNIDLSTRLFFIFTDNFPKGIPSKKL